MAASLNSSSISPQRRELAELMLLPSNPSSSEDDLSFVGKIVFSQGVLNFEKQLGTQLLQATKERVWQLLSAKITTEVRDIFLNEYCIQVLAGYNDDEIKQGIEEYKNAEPDEIFPMPLEPDLMFKKMEEINQTMKRKCFSKEREREVTELIKQALSTLIIQFIAFQYKQPMLTATASGT